ncbi:endonuclease V [Maribacter sp. 2-571]|uniref:endonuclease V n=1 Tax=Maribacter sp. 2-571 TaxID=3417569 RepID=UPI003D353707
MILVFDSYYFDQHAKTVGIGFDSWTDEKPVKVFSEIRTGIPAYEPGAFYKRELPCIVSLLEKIDLSDIDLIIVDSFVVLDDNGTLGLGGHLFEKLDQKIPVIGVAKSSFHLNKKRTKALLRGKSKKPLYISSAGIALDRAYEHIKAMHGKYRMPTLLQILDGMTKETAKMH